MSYQQKYIPKPLFIERMKMLLESESDFQNYMEILEKPIANAIRCNTLKINADELKKRLEKKGWKIKQPFKNYPEIMLIENQLEPGELGKAMEHLLGYYYVQEISSMLSIIALSPKSSDIMLDLCAAPGSKTSQAAAFMENSGTIVANDKDIIRISILATNLERCGASNVIITRHDGVILCEKLKKLGMKFDKILLDVPCSGEGTIRSSPKTFLMWNLKMIEKLGRLQKKLSASAISLLKNGGELVYSTCTHAPEENEAVIHFLLENFPLKIQEIKLPLKCRKGITSWKGEKFNDELKKACRIYPHDNDTEGFFIAKLKKVEEGGIK